MTLPSQIIPGVNVYRHDGKISILMSGGFGREFSIPGGTDPEKITAELGFDTLVITFPKRDESGLQDPPAAEPLVAAGPEEDPFFADLLQKPALREQWEKHTSARRLALALVGMRRKAGRTQKQVAEAAGWDQGYVSRLEFGRGPLPEVATVQRYAKACGGRSAYVLSDSEGATIQVEA